MKQKVIIETLDNKTARPVKGGEVFWDGETLSAKETGKEFHFLMESMLIEPIKLLKDDMTREPISPKDEPERFFNNLWRVFRGAYLHASRPQPPVIPQARVS